MKKPLSLLFVVLALFSLFSCKGAPGAPEQPKPPKIEYNIQILYVRPPGSILYPAAKDTPPWAYISDHCWGGVDFDLHKIDDHHFTSDFKPVPDNEGDPFYTLEVHDSARSDGVHSDMSRVGDILVLRVRETGFEKQLFNIKQDVLICNPYRGPNARMAVFHLKKDGTITDD